MTVDELYVIEMYNYFFACPRLLSGWSYIYYTYSLQKHVESDLFSACCTYIVCSYTQWHLSTYIRTESARDKRPAIFLMILTTRKTDVNCSIVAYISARCLSLSSICVDLYGTVLFYDRHADKMFFINIEQTVHIDLWFQLVFFFFIY